MMACGSIQVGAVAVVLWVTRVLPLDCSRFILQIFGSKQIFFMQLAFVQLARLARLQHNTSHC